MQRHCLPLGRKQRPRQICMAFLPWRRRQRSAEHVCSGCGLHSHATDVKAQGSSSFCPDGCGAEGGGVGDLGRSTFFPCKKGLDLLRKLLGVQLQFLAIPRCGIGSPNPLVATGLCSSWMGCGWSCWGHRGDPEMLLRMSSCSQSTFGSSVPLLALEGRSNLI